MPEQYFSAFREELLNSGIPPRHVERLVGELKDHLEDLRQDALMHGEGEEMAVVNAREMLGDLSVLAAKLRERVELRAWVYRHPHIARVYLPVAYVLLLPAAPLFAGLANPGEAIRWGAALMLSAGLTACLFLSMQLAIALT